MPKIDKLPADNLTVEEIMAKAQADYTDTPELPNILLFGDSGSGKTTLLRTCPMPAHLFVLDPGADRGKFLGPLIKGGKITVHRFYEDARKPTCFQDFFQRFEYLADKGAFNEGTVFVDSYTMLERAAMNFVLGPRAESGAVPELRDYMIQQTFIKQWLTIALHLPCLFVMTAHVDRIKDEQTGVVHTTLAAGKEMIKYLNASFDEVWAVQAKDVAGKEPDYGIITTTSEGYKARTRIGSGVFKVREEADISKLLKKAEVL